MSGVNVSYAAYNGGINYPLNGSSGLTGDTIGYPGTRFQFPMVYHIKISHVDIHCHIYFHAMMYR